MELALACRGDRQLGTMAAGAAHSPPLKADGTVAGWGWNSEGQLKVPRGLNSVAAVGAGSAVEADGSGAKGGSP